MSIYDNQLLCNHPGNSAHPALQLYHSMNNNRLCPICRNPLPTNTCKKCGYKQKVLQVVDTQQEFGKLNYLNKVQKTSRQFPTIRQLSKQEKLLIYLQEYQKLLKKAIDKLIEAKQLNTPIGLELKQQTKNIWQQFLVKKKEINSPLAGFLKKYLTNYKIQRKTDKQHLLPEENKEDNRDQQEEREEDRTETKKRRRTAKSKEPKELSTLTQLRCYLHVSVKPLLKQSTQQKALNQQELTSAQKSFLSYLLAIKTADHELLKLSSHKYFKMLYTLSSAKIQQSYIKQSQISPELERRNLSSTNSKDRSILAIMLYDLLRCWNQANHHLENQVTLRQMINLYQTNQEKVPAIQAILEQLENQTAPENPNIPQICYQLIYSIAHLATIKTGLTISLGEIISCIGRLQIPKIKVQQDLFLAGVANQEVISCQKIRKTSHLLAHFLNLKFPCFISKWSLKWCQKLNLNPFVQIIELINRIIFEQAKQKVRKSNSLGPTHNYHRYFELEQDIASIAGIVVFLKLADGINDYPYLVLSQPQQLTKSFSISSEEMKLLKPLIKNKKVAVTLTNQEDHSIKIKYLPALYQNPLNLLNFSKRLSQLNRFDKQLGYQQLNHKIIKTRTLSNLNNVSTLQLTQYFKQSKEQKIQQQSNSQIKLRYNEMQHFQWSQKKNKDSKHQFVKVQTKKVKESVEISDDLKKQLSCIVGDQEEIAAAEEGTQEETCLVDQPCSNYQLMYEYSAENLVMVNRHQQLYLMEQLCLNNCTYSELTGWLCAYQSILKHYQTR